MLALVYRCSGAREREGERGREEGRERVSVCVRERGGKGERDGSREKERERA